MAPTIASTALVRNAIERGWLLPVVWQAAGAEVNAGGRGGWKPLHRAVFTGNLAVVEALLASGSDPAGEGKNGDTPLHWGAKSNENPVIVEALLEAGAEPETPGDGSDTALHLAVERGHLALLEALRAAEGTAGGAGTRESNALTPGVHSQQEPRSRSCWMAEEAL